ncbi:MAG: hypothetical protein APF84_19220 [Gracilibacter sp. BRH_c7a]|nr:MAG: hypothetical protein APF84_19220 [Gracilibacter sp. BRH_c7a]
MEQKIIDSTIKQIKQFGLKRFTMDDIAQDLGISKKTLYQYYPSKRELLQAVVQWVEERERTITDQALAGADSWLERLDAVLSVYSFANLPYRLMNEVNRSYLGEYEGISRIGQYKSEALRKILQEGLETGKLKQEINPEVIILTLDKMFFTLTAEDFLQENDLTVNQLLQQMKTLLFFGSLTTGSGL